MGIRALRDLSTFDALRNRHFRWLWAGRMVFSASYAMEPIAQGWLVYELTGSATALALVTTGYRVGLLLLSLYGGALSDRLQKRSLLLWIRVALALNAFVLGLVISAGLVQLWLLIASALVGGLLFVFMSPIQQALSAQLVDKRTILNAMALGTIGQGIMAMLASPAAGVLINRVGVAGVYYLIAVLHLISGLLALKLPRTAVSDTGRRSVWSDVAACLRYTIREKALLPVFALSLSRVLFIMAFWTLIPKYAKEVVGVGAAGAGALVSSLVVASLGDFRRKGIAFLADGVAVGVLLALTVNMPYIASSMGVPTMVLLLPLMVLLGAVDNALMVLNQAILQTSIEDRFRGRVASVYMMLWGLEPAGTLPAGAIADRVGVPPVVSAYGLALALVFAGMWAFKPSMRRVE